MASTEKRFTVTGGKPSYTDTVSGYKYEYDANNNLTKLTCSVNNTTWATTYTYDKDNRPTTATLHNGKQIVDTYDKLGRITKRRLGLSANYDTDITYIQGANGSKTALVGTYKNGSDDAYTYAYDANGNITSITKGSQNFTYTYDAANQLVRENLKYGASDPNNATYTYEYDEWGNILNKKKYAYTTGALGSVQNTVSYGYSNNAWKDKLTSYNGQSISYDSMGNPTSYLGANLTWNGKQLTGYSESGTNVTYAYNEDGLRTQKTHNGTITDYYYNGSVLIGMQSGNITQRFSYDAQGKVVAVDYSENGGSTYTTYYYLRNAQGDIVKLIDNGGDTKVEYIYDSWGKVLAVTGSLATTLGENQPFRYRGYVYDSDTNLYYLQSRYYNPSLGRFISSDVYLSTGQGVIGHNSYAYCGNNPIARVDEDGKYWKYLSRCINTIIGLIKVGPVVKYDVPLYNQKSYRLCWAFSQVMMVAYNQGLDINQKQAEMLAVLLAMQKAGSNKKDKWNQGGWPTNVLPDGAADVKIRSIYQLYSLLLEYGPIYAFYRRSQKGKNGLAHLVVVTGVDLVKGLVYTNNPWGYSGSQTFSAFLNGFLGAKNIPLSHCLVPVGVKKWRLL